MNWTLFAAVIAAVAGFGSSSRLASAYGVAVLTMAVTTVLAFFVRFHWGYPLWLVVVATAAFLFIGLILRSHAIFRTLRHLAASAAAASFAFLGRLFLFLGQRRGGGSFATATPNVVTTSTAAISARNVLVGLLHPRSFFAHRFTPSVDG